MPLDYNSLLMAIGFAGACLSVTMFGTWLSARAETFLLTWAIGVALIVGNVVAYSFYVQNPVPVAAIAAFSQLMLGFAVILGAAYQFRVGETPWRLVAGTAALAVLAVAGPLASGYDGLGFIHCNVAATLLLFATARQYWLGRAEAPVPIIALAVLYACTGVSFSLCAFVLIADGKLVLGKAPDNWAEQLNLAVSIACLAGIGALSLALNQSRLARSHRREAMTDPLTGLLNRRAIFDQFGSDMIGRFTGVLVFDLDQFKRVNDRYGHTVGDEVLRRFASIVTDCLRDTDTAARLGGEEFVAVLPRSTPERARSVGERIRESFAELVVETDRGNLSCTVSVGIAFPPAEGATFETVLGQADKALYSAKDSGRNRVVAQGARLAG